MTDEKKPFDVIEGGMSYSGRARPFTSGDHVELAKWLLADLRLLGCVIHCKGTTWKYDLESGIYSPVPVADLSCLLQKYSGATLASGKLKMKKSDVSGAISLAQDQITDDTFFDKPPAGMAFRNGFVKISPGSVELQPHSHDHRAVFSYPFDYVPWETQHTIQWHQFLKDAFLGDEDCDQKIEAIHEFVGACLLGVAPKLSRCLFLRGTEDGANAKSRLLFIIEKIMPPGSTSTISPKDMTNPCFLARLHGKLLNAVTELPQSSILETNIFKAVVTGDRVEARRLYKDPFNFCPYSGHIFAVNKLPPVDDLTNAFWRRILIIAFNRSFQKDPKKDPNIADKILQSELSGIVSLMLQYGSKILESLDNHKEYTIPSSHYDELQKWTLKIDSVRAFIHEKCERCDAKDGMPGSAALDYYKVWALEEGLKPVGRNEFIQRCKQAGFETVHFENARQYPFRLK